MRARRILFLFFYCGLLTGAWRNSSHGGRKAHSCQLYRRTTTTTTAFVQWQRRMEEPQEKLLTSSLSFSTTRLLANYRGLEVKREGATPIGTEDHEARYYSLSRACVYIYIYIDREPASVASLNFVFSHTSFL